MSRQEMPRALGRAGSVRTNTLNMVPCSALETNIFVPLTTHWSCSRRAAVRSAAASEPEPGSVSAIPACHAPVAICGKYVSRCASVPKCRIIHAAATVLLWDGETEKAQRPHLLDDGGGIAVFQLILHSDGPDLPVHECLHHLADALLYLVELEIHRAPPRRVPARRYPMMPPSRRAAISLSSMPSSRSTAAVSALVLGGCTRRGASPLKRTGKRPRRRRP